MKKVISILLIAMTLLLSAGCGGDGAVDVLLVADDVLSPVAIYSMASNILQDPDGYAGKSVKAEGEAVYSTDSATGYFIRISDSTACCFVDIEFSVPEGKEAPEEGTVFQLSGTIGSYKGADNKNAVRFDADSFIYEDELRELYEAEE